MGERRHTRSTEGPPVKSSRADAGSDDQQPTPLLPLCLPQRRWRLGVRHNRRVNLSGFTEALSLTTGLLSVGAVGVAAARFVTAFGARRQRLSQVEMTVEAISELPDGQVRDLWRTLLEQNVISDSLPAQVILRRFAILVSTLIFSTVLLSSSFAAYISGEAPSARMPEIDSPSRLDVTVIYFAHSLSFFLFVAFVAYVFWCLRAAATRE